MNARLLVAFCIPKQPSLGDSGYMLHPAVFQVGEVVIRYDRPYRAI
jgi:hypothetical protein